MKRLHLVPTIDSASGVYRVACDLAGEDGGEVKTLAAFLSASFPVAVEEVWVHGMWLPRTWRACGRVLRAGRRLVRMTHGSLSPVYLTRQSPWKKRLVGPIERALLRRADRVVVTCAAEAEWVKAYCPAARVELTDLTRFFAFPASPAASGPCHRFLYLGRLHPLKGMRYLETAAKAVPGVELRVESGASGAALEEAWRWCEVLVLPTLSENFGRVVAEALSRGKRVITTDGAPAWAEGKGGNRLVYLKGFCAGTDAERIRLLRNAIVEFALLS